MNSNMIFKRLIFVLFMGTVLLSCKKLVHDAEENEAIQIITNGTWYVEQYLNDSLDITGSFSGYVFQFNQNGTVVGTRDSISTTGTWSANVSSRSITANFPGAGGPLNKLNGVWTITDSSIDYVVADATISDSTENLRLQKN